MAGSACTSRSILPDACGSVPTSNGSTEESYTVDPQRADSFYDRIRTYWPGLPARSLVPDYCGIRPKLTGRGEPAADFMIAEPTTHGLPRLVNLFGIESPGLTSSLSLAQEVVSYLVA